MSIALLPGSYDPMTLGHLNLVERALEKYDEVIVAVMNNRQKHYETTLAERAEIARLTVGRLPRVRILTDEGLLVDLFDKVGADTIVKGMRNEEDRAYEEEMAAWNLSHNEKAVTVFFAADPRYREVSSHAVRERVCKGEDLAGFLAPAAAAYIAANGLYKAPRTQNGR